MKFQPIDGEPCGFTCTEINVSPQKNGVYDIQFIGHEYGYQNIAREEICPCYLAFDEGRNYSEALKQYQKVNRKALDKRDRERKRIERARRRHMRALARQQLTRENEFASWRQKSADRRVTRTLEVLQFGILNIDKPYVLDAPVELMASYTDSLGAPLLLENLQVMDISSRVLYPCKNERVQLHPMQKQVLFGTTPSGDLAFDTSLYRNERLRDRPFISADWRLRVDRRKCDTAECEQVNQDITWTKLSDIVLYVYYTDQSLL